MSHCDGDINDGVGSIKGTGRYVTLQSEVVIAESAKHIISLSVVLIEELP
jgi:hypothetical protein